LFLYSKFFHFFGYFIIIFTTIIIINTTNLTVSARETGNVRTQSVLSYISTSSTTNTLRLPLYILSEVDPYQKAYGTGKRVMMVMVMVQGTYVL
jgi:hypothetical protein